MSAESVEDVAVGQCTRCKHAQRVPHPRGGTSYWMCAAAAPENNLKKYPPLPVHNCPLFQEK